MSFQLIVDTIYTVASSSTAPPVRYLDLFVCSIKIFVLNFSKRNTQKLRQENEGWICRMYEFKVEL
jgi:hypothetical protein